MPEARKRLFIETAEAFFQFVKVRAMLIQTLTRSGYSIDDITDALTTDRRTVEQTLGISGNNVAGSTANPLT